MEFEQILGSFTKFQQVPIKYASLERLSFTVTKFEQVSIKFGSLEQILITFARLAQTSILIAKHILMQLYLYVYSYHFPVMMYVI